MDAIVAEGLVKTYRAKAGPVRALDGLDLAVPEGSVLGLLGPNGAGKTTTGLDPRSRLGMWDVIRERVRAGTTLLLTTQYLEEADALADSIFVVDSGKVIARGTADALKAQVGGERIEVVVRERTGVARRGRPPGGRPLVRAEPPGRCPRKTVALAGRPRRRPSRPPCPRRSVLLKVRPRRRPSRSPRKESALPLTWSFER
jgi:ABC-type multidrug transport system ATPase subunit